MERHQTCIWHLYCLISHDSLLLYYYKYIYIIIFQNYFHKQLCSCACRNNISIRTHCFNAGKQWSRELLSQFSPNISQYAKLCWALWNCSLAQNTFSSDIKLFLQIEITFIIFKSVAPFTFLLVDRRQLLGIRLRAFQTLSRCVIKV